MKNYKNRVFLSFTELYKRFCLIFESIQSFKSHYLVESIFFLCNKEKNLLEKLIPVTNVFIAFLKPELVLYVLSLSGSK